MLRRCISTVRALPTHGGYRFKLLLPSIRGCWFTFSNTDSIGKLHSAIKAADPLIKTITSGYAEDAPFTTALHTDGGIKLLINDSEVQILRVQAYTENGKVTPLAQLMEAVAAQKPNSKEELEQMVLSGLRPFREETIAKIEQLSAQILDVQEQINVLETAKSRLDAKINRKITFYSLSAFSFITVQWSFFFYTIYMVEWLGWDLMEPITYSVGQLGFLFGVWYFRRTQVPNSFLGISTRYRQRSMKKMTLKSNLDLDLLARLVEKRGELKIQRRKLFSRIVKGGPLPD